VKSIKHNYTFYPKHLLWLLLVSFILIGKTSYAQEKKLLWEISNDDSVVYLVGTVHALEWHDYPLDILYEEAYRVADRVVFEVDLSSFGPEDAENFIQQNGFYPQGQTIRSHVSNKTYNLLREAAQAQGLDFNEVVKIKPWVWAFSFIDAMIQQSDLDPELGIDQLFSDKAAQDNKEIMELETWIDQLKIFSDAPLDKQGKYLDEIVNDLESNSIGDEEAAVDAWRDSDLSQLDTLVEEIRERDDYAYGRLIKDRNNKWVPKIINYLNMPGTTTVFAGAAHFAGKDSVVKLLDRINYKATRLPSPPRLLHSPTNQTLNEGSSVTLSSQFRSLSTISYIWFHNGRTLEGENDPTLEINSISEKNAGSYILKATNEAGSTTTTAVELRVIQKPKPPEIIQQPQDLIIGLGKEATFSINGQGTEPLNYQWYKDGKQIAGATDATCRIASVSQGDLGIYSVRVQNKAGKAYSQTVKLSLAVLHTLTVASRDSDSGVTVTLSPLDWNGQAGGTTQFTRVYSKGTEVTLTAVQSVGANQFKEWLKNGEPAGTEPTVTVMMDYDRTLRAVYEVGIQSPLITTHPISHTVDAGASVTFSVAATGTQPLSYRWRRNGGFLGSATESPTLTLGNVQPEQGGTYRVVVSNGAGEAMSEAAELVVKETLHTLTVASRDPDSGITVTVSPADENGHSDGTTQFTRVYSKGTEVTLSAKQSVGSNEFKQWLANGVPVSNESTVVVTMDYDRTLRAVFYKHGPIELMNPNTTISPFTFTFIAKESSTYEVQVTQDLKNWSKLGELKGKSGEVRFTDPRLPKVPYKRNYFRVKLVD
jgi:uncharacterized protein YbaP (TraB family)